MAGAGAVIHFLCEGRRTARVTGNCVSAMYTGIFDACDVAFRAEYTEQAVTDPDFDALLTDLLAESPQQTPQSGGDGSSSSLALPWAPLLQFDPGQTFDGTTYQELPAPTQQFSSTAPSSSHTDTSDSQGQRQPARGARVSGSSSKATKGSSKRSEAWILKNRRAQQKFRAKEKVGNHSYSTSTPGHNTVCLQQVSLCRSTRHS